MRFKRIMILTIVLVTLLAVSAVSAAENATGDVVSVKSPLDDFVGVENQTGDSGENSLIGIGQSQEILTADEGTYTDLRNDIGSGGNINLTKSYYRYTEGDGSTIEIKNPGVIDGKGAVIDMAGSTIRAFQVTAFGDVTIKNLTIKNVNFRGSGSVILFNTAGAVTNCNFINSTAGTNGGVVYFMKNGKVTNCNFTNNNVSSSGGAVYFMKNGEVTNCNFINNTARRAGGGAIFISSGTVTNCSFTDSSASFGGAIFFSLGGKVINCNFTNNAATSDNGSAILFSTTGTVTNCNFINNTAFNSGTVYMHDHDKKGLDTVTNCNFTNNKATNGNGGAVLFVNGGTVSNCNFINNTATHYKSWGGAIYFNYGGTVSNCNFTDNKVTLNGGAVFFWDGRSTVTNCSFTKNKATNGDGGAIGFYSEGTVTNCNFIYNKATNGDGGAIFFLYESTVINCNFTNNTASNGGGAIFFGNDGTVTNSNFTGNNASTGSAIYFELNPLTTKTVSNSIFLNNRADAKALEVTQNENKITITFTGKDNHLNAIYSEDDIEFIDVFCWGANGITKIGDYGGITQSGSNKEAGQNITLEIYDINDNLVDNVTLITDDNGQATYDFIKLSNGNYAYKAYHSEDSYYTYAENTGTFTLDGLGDFNRLQRYINEADANSVLTLYCDYTFTIYLDENLGGGILIDKPITIKGNGHTINALEKARIFHVNASSINITGLTFKNGKADSGGAILFEMAIFNSNINASFINNTAEQWGGANYFISLVSDSNVTGTYVNNTAKFCYGGANYFAGKVSGSNIAGTYTNNKAKGDGGANCFWNSLTNVTITGDYANNTANVGGANYFYNELTNVTITGDYTNNKAIDGYGGANYFEKALTNVTITGDYTNNTAEYSGGANKFAYTLSNVNITGIYSNNSAKNGNGGANYFQNTLTNVVITGDYTGNTADVGGANFFNIYLINVVITGDYTGNTAEYSGGANYFRNTLNVTITGDYYNNSAKDSGGANYFSEKLTNVTIFGDYTGNTAAANGAASYFQYKLTNVVIKGNYTNNNNAAIICFVNNVNYLNISGAFINNSGSYVIYNSHSFENSVIKDSIFLNNNVSKIYYGAPDIQMVNNWFGNNATNYNVAPDTGYAQLDNWLFLNATVDPVSFTSSTNVTFKLDSYGAKAKVVNDYNNSLINPIELTLTSINSTVKNSTHLNEAVKYVARDSNRGSVTATFENAEYTIELQIYKNPNMTVESGTFNYNESITLALNYNPNATGNVSVTLNGKKHTYNYAGLALNVTVMLSGDILPDEYNVTVRYGGDVNFFSASANSTLAIKKANSTLKIADITFDYNSTGLCEVTFTNATGVAAEVIGHNEAIINVTNNLIAVSGLDAGNYTLSVTTITGEGYSNVTQTSLITVKPASSEVAAENVNVTYGEDINIAVESTNATEIKYEIIKDNKVIANDTINAGDDITDLELAAGTYTVNLTTVTDLNHISSSGQSLLTVNKAPSIIDVNGTGAYCGEDVVLNYTAVNAINVSVSIVDFSKQPLADGIDYNMTITADKIIISDLKEGKYTVVVTTIVDANHTSATKNVTVYVNPICDLEVVLTPIYSTAYYGDIVTWNATIINHGPSWPSNVYLVAYAPEGLVFESSGGDNPNYYRLSIPFTLYPEIPLSVFLKTAVNATNTNLTLNVSVSDKYLPDSNPKSNNASASVEIVYANASVNVTADYEITAVDDLTVNVELPGDATGDVAVSVDGEKIAEVPVSSGSANITLPALAIGNHTVEITYSGDDKYAPVSETANVTVSKASVNLTASAKTFKDTDKTKKYTVTLKDSNGNPIANATVTLKVNGKTYAARTNSNGVATFKLNKLTKKGTYTATITYAGDEKYNNVSAKAKIIVKSAWKTISKGSKYHSMVKKIQRALKLQGFYLSYNGRYLKVDGIFHTYTEMAVKQFQKANKLKVTGKVDEKTAKKLGII